MSRDVSNLKFFALENKIKQTKIWVMFTVNDLNKKVCKTVPIWIII
jgi:hypothetical protein